MQDAKVTVDRTPVGMNHATSSYVPNPQKALADVVSRGSLYRKVDAMITQRERQSHGKAPQSARQILDEIHFATRPEGCGKDFELVNLVDIVAKGVDTLEIHLYGKDHVMNTDVELLDVTGDLLAMSDGVSDASQTDTSETELRKAG